MKNPEFLPINSRCHDATVLSCFRSVCRTSGSVPAVISPTGMLTYSELDARSDRFAAGVLSRNPDLAVMESEPLALIWMDAPLQDQLVATLGILKAGMAFAFQDSRTSSHVVHQAVVSTGIDVIVGNRAAFTELSAGSFYPARGVVYEDIMENLGNAVDLPVPKANQLARVLFTSGSSAAPKGVEHEHRMVVHISLMFQELLDFQPGQRQLLLSPLHHMTGSSILFISLLSGGTLCPYPLQDRGVDELPQWLMENRIDHYRSGLTVFRSFVQALRDRAHLAGIRSVHLGGEKTLLPDVLSFRKWFPVDSRLISNFGSSECSSIASWQVTPEIDLSDHPVPAGHVPADKLVTVQDSDGCEVPDGEVGEIVVRSRYIARGYRRDPELTARCFTFPESEPGVRIFRTGDFGRFLPDGRLECVGRRDAQVKVNGHRVECSGVESVLLSLPGVELAAVIPLEVEPGNFRLTAFVKPVNFADMADPPALERNLRQHLQERVAAYAVPATIKIVDAMPLTRSGKIDRGVLEGELRDATTPSQAPARSGTESTLWDIWAEALGHKDFGVDDSFFGIGGNSLTAVRLINRVHRAFGIRLQVRDVFEYSTVAEMAAYLESRR